MGKLWAAFSGEKDPGVFETHRTTTAPPMRRSPFWGFLTGQYEEYQALLQAEPEEIEATAYHEAGHARAARKSGFEVGGMWAHQDGSGRTRVRIDDLENAKNLRSTLIGLIAGQESEIRYWMGKHHYTRKEAERLTHHAATSDRAQFEQVAKGTGYTWENLQPEARKFVKRNAYTIEQNARPLARRGHRGGTWA